MIYTPKKVRITGFKRESHDAFTIRINWKIKHDPGQFVQVSLPGIGECPISICSFSPNYIDLNVREVGNVTNALSKLKKGKFLLVRGPYGNGYPMKPLVGNNIVVIGGGCGIAPLKGIIEYIDKNRNDFKEVHLFLGYRSPADLLFEDSLKKWKGKFNLNLSFDKADIKTCFDARTAFITQLVEEAPLDNHNKVVFICGPPIMMEKTIAILEKKGFNHDQIFISAERLMHCGIGKCGHCMIHGKYTCIDGPVFRYDQLR